MDFRIDGLDELIDKLDSATDPKDQRRRILAARCPTHGKHPTNVRKRGTKWTMDLCCEGLGRIAAKAMHGPT